MTPPPPLRASIAPAAGIDAVTPIGALATSGAAVSPHDLVRDVADRFFRERDLDAVALVEGGVPSALLTRSRLLLKLARGFGQELYARKPVARIADADALVLPGDMPLAAAVERAVARPAESVYDEVIVADAAGRFAGLLSVRELVVHQGSELARAVAQRETALSRARDLEELDALRARFLAHATHELRSPVNAIVCAAELMRMDVDRGAWTQAQERLAMLLRTSADLRLTVNTMLDLSKLEAGRMEVNVAPVALAPLVADVADAARVLVAGRPIEVATAVAPGLAIATDRAKARQIVLNLASNAAKFTERGRITVSAEEEPAGVRISVTDTGPGIREEDLARLFVAFGQLEDARTKSHEGTGLGLVISRSLAELLGGRLSVASRHGHGSTFTLHLPRVLPEDAP